MIRPLRARHRATWLALAVVLPVALVVALRARAPVPANAQTPTVDAVGRDGAVEPVQMTYQRDDLWGALPVRTSLLVGSTRQFVELQPLRDLRQPDVLVYWLADPFRLPPGRGGSAGVCGTPSAEGVPPDALLLGRLAGTRAHRYALPPQVDAQRGKLLLYSLGHQRALGTAHLAPPNAGS